MIRYIFIQIICLFLLIQITYAADIKLKTIGELSPVLNDTLDDFNDLNDINNWRCFTYYGGDGGTGTCSLSFATNNGYAGGYAKLTYNVPTTGSYSWYATKMGLLNLNAGNYNGLTFMVKGLSGGEYFKIALKTDNCNNTNRRTSLIYINDFLDNGITTSWQKVIIPLKNFANITNFSKMVELSIAFEHDSSSKNNSPTSSTIFIDNIKFTNSLNGFNIFKIDYFSDNNDYNAVGSKIETLCGNGATGYSRFSDAPGTYTNYKYGFELDYTNIQTTSYPNGWIVSVFKFGGGADNSTAMPTDISNYSNITFYAKNKNNKNNPKQLQITLKDTSSGVSVYTAEPSGGNNPVFTTNWQKITVSLTNFNSLDLKNITQIEFAINQWCSDVTNIGTVYIDKLQLEK